MTTLTSEQLKPTNIEVDIKKSKVRITWADNLLSQYSLEYLRKICPCAQCRTQRDNQDPLRVITSDQAAISAILEAGRPAEMVGNYALQFFWDDGHRTGIYTFEYLRQNSP